MHAYNKYMMKQWEPELVWRFVLKMFSFGGRRRGIDEITSVKESKNKTKTTRAQNKNVKHHVNLPGKRKYMPVKKLTR